MDQSQASPTVSCYLESYALISFLLLSGVQLEGSDEQNGVSEKYIVC